MFACSSLGVLCLLVECERWLSLTVCSLSDYDLWSKIKPQPVEIRPGDINDYYEIHEELGRFVSQK